MDLHIMVDLETMGTGHDAPILAIGACVFDPVAGLIGETFLQRITLESNVEEGRPIDPNTVEWWLKQSKDAQKALIEEPRHVLVNALCNWIGWLMQRVPGDTPLDWRKFLGSRQARLWSMGPTFDENILRHAFKASRMPFPFGYGGSRCVRTIVEIAKELGMQKLQRAGTHHNALADAIYQAQCVCSLYKRIGIPHPSRQES